MILRAWRWFWSPSSKYAWGLIFLLGGVGGIVFWGGFNTFMEYTNRMEFCISCHEMRETVYEEYKTSVHYQNASGVRVICSDCHVPREWTAKLVRKIRATNELYHHLVGTIDTPEKYEAKRLELAQHVWDSMEASDSQECRNCHTYEAMAFHKQEKKAAELMQKAQEEGETCISCHKGLVHKLPDMTKGYKAMLDALVVEAGEKNTSSDVVHTVVMTPMFFAPEKTDAKGKGPVRLLAATALKVLERDDDRLQVRLDGWQQEGAEKVFYALMGHRIFSATLGKAAIAEVDRHETLVDPDTEITWHRASLIGWIPADSVVDDQAQLWAYGKEMYNASCSTCHSLPAPNHFLANQWIGTLKSMKRFITLDKEEYRFLQKYLQFHAKDTAGDGHS